MTRRISLISIWRAPSMTMRAIWPFMATFQEQLMAKRMMAASRQLRTKRLGRALTFCVPRGNSRHVFIGMLDAVEIG